MKLPPFEYRVATSVGEATELLAELGDEAKVLAGGQSLIPLLSFRLARPAYLIDVSGISELATITDSGALEIGATVRHRMAERSPLVKDVAPLVAFALRFVGHAAIRNRGTIGGSIAHADPAAELPTVLTALGGEVVLNSIRGSRSMSVDRFIEGFLSTAIEPDELLTSTRFPKLEEGSGWSFNEFSRRSGDFAIVGVAALVGLGAGGRVANATLVFSGVGSTPVRATEAERLLIGEIPSSELWAAASEVAAAALDPISDLHGTSAYRQQLARVLGRRSLQQAHDRAKGARGE